MRKISIIAISATKIADLSLKDSKNKKKAGGFPFSLLLSSRSINTSTQDLLQPKVNRATFQGLENTQLLNTLNLINFPPVAGKIDRIMQLETTECQALQAFQIKKMFFAFYKNLICGLKSPDFKKVVNCKDKT